jgi:hypothetical protein
MGSPISGSWLNPASVLADSSCMVEAEVRVMLSSSGWCTGDPGINSTGYCLYKNILEPVYYSGSNYLVPVFCLVCKFLVKYLQISVVKGYGTGIYFKREISNLFGF